MIMWKIKNKHYKRERERERDGQRFGQECWLTGGSVSNSGVNADWE